MSELIAFVQSIFAQSATAGFTVVLVVWLIRAWWFRLLDVGVRRSVADDLLTAATLGEAVAANQTLSTLGACAVGGTKDERWTALEVFGVYWILRARGWIVKVASGMVVFVGCSLIIMSLAQPTGQVSLINVAGILGWLSVFAVLMLAALALVTLVTSAHTLPRGVARKVNNRAFVMVAW